MELKNKNLISSPEYLFPLLIFFLFQAAFGIAGLLSTYFLLDYQTQLMDDRLFAMVNRVVTEYPLAEEEIIRTVTAGVKPEDVSSGFTLLNQYGYTITTPLYLKPISTPLLSRYLVHGAILGILLMGGSLAVYNTTRMPLLKKIDELSKTTLTILDGADPPNPVDPGEGIWSLLEHRHNQLVRKMQSGTDKLREEKLFLKQILSDISHQLKTPMASLVMYTDLMILDPMIPEERRQEFLNHCSCALERMELLVKNLLKLARMEVGAIDFCKVPVNIKTMLEQIVTEIDPRKGNRNIIITEESEITAALETDPHWTREVFSNLLINALNHTADSGTIHFTLQQTPLFLRVCVTDDGTGIAEEDLPRIFERFFRGGTPGNNDSAGIGLSLCRTILSAQGADIRAGNLPGGGAEFTVTFPYRSVS